MPFGKELQLERTKLGVPLESVAAGTKVSHRYLQSLEADDFASLPGGVFQRGIVRSYCRFLGLDEQEWLVRFSSATQFGSNDMDWAEFAENVKRSRISNRSSMAPRWWGVAAMVVVLAVAGWAVWDYVVRPRMTVQHSQVLHMAPRALSQTRNYFTNSAKCLWKMHNIFIAN